MTTQSAPGNDLSESIPLELSEKLFQDDEFKDVTFKLDDGEVQAHRNVLAATSCVFKAMLSSPMTEARTGEIRIPNVQVATMRTFLRLLYTGQVESADWTRADDSKPSNKVPIQIMLDLARLARQYMVDAVIQLVVEAVKNRLAEEHDTTTIQVILAAAISENLGAIRVAAMEAARASQKMRELYDKQDLQPAVQAELQAIWPPAPRSMKRCRLE